MANSEIRDFLQSFKILGGNKNGKIDYEKFKSCLIEKCGATEEEIEEIIAAENCCEDGQLDYIKLCTSIFTTKAIFDRLTSEHEKSSSTKTLNSHTFTKKKGSSRPSTASSQKKENISGSSRPSTTSSQKKENISGSSLPSTAPSQKKENISSKAQAEHADSLRGCIFNSPKLKGMHGNRYLLEINKDSSVEIVAKAIDSEGNSSPKPVIEILVFVENDEPVKTLVTFSTLKNSEGYCLVKATLKCGNYLLVPITSNMDISYVEKNSEMIPLTDVNETGEVTLTPSCKDALRKVFSIIDLDGNDLLNQLEFDLFMQYISGESAAEEWSTVEENFETIDGQLTFRGFLSLYHMAIETDLQDVINMFHKMGMDSSLNMKKAAPFYLTVIAETAKPCLKPLPVGPFSVLMDKVFRKTALEEGQRSKVRNLNDLSLFIHKLPHRITIVIQNQSHSKVKLRLDCSKSENCTSHRKALDCTFEVPPRTSIVGHHLFPVNVNAPWSVKYIETVIK